MKYNCKISLPIYKIAYSIIYIIALVFLKQIAFIEDIGPVLDIFMPFLAIIFSADIYYQEVSNNRAEIMQLVPDKKWFNTMCQRLLISILFITILAIASYWLYYGYQPRTLSGKSDFLIFLFALLAIFCSITFFSILSFTVVNVSKNILVGMGISIVVWMVLSSSIKEQIPDMINIFAYCKDSRNYSELGGEWIVGGIIYVMFSIILLLWNKKLLTWVSRKD